MMADSFAGWMLFSIIWFYGLYHLLYCAASGGYFGNAVLTYMAFGKIDPNRDRDITKCIAYTEAGKYIAKMNSSNYITFYDADLYERGYKVEARQYAFVVTHYNHEEFGYRARWIGSTSLSYSKSDNENGTISFANRNALWNLKMNLTGEIVLPPEKKSLFTMFKKEEVDLQ